MAAATVNKSVQHLLEALVLGTDAPSGQVYAGTITATIPTAGANATKQVNATVTGAALGDIVLISGPTVALSNLGAVVATVTAADTISLVGIADGTGYTGASKVYNYVMFKQS